MTRVRHAQSAVLVLVILTLSLNAYGEAANALANGRSLWRSFEYEDAIVQLQAVIADSQATAAQRLEALELMGVLHLTLNREAQAQEAFVRLLALDPGHNLTDPGYPPRVQQFFATARQSFIPQISLDIDPIVPSVMPTGGSITLSAMLSGSTDGVERAMVFIRTEGETNYRQALMQRNGLQFTANVPTPPEGRSLEYYFEVQAPSGHVLGRNGSASEPQMLESGAPSPVPPTVITPGMGDDDTETPPGIIDESGDVGGGDDVRRPFYRTWWFWTVMGVVVVGATATGLGVGLQNDLDPGSLGSIALP